jgi:transposase, IS5 family
LVASALLHDSQMLKQLLLGTESQLYADAAYSAQEQRETLARHGIEDKVQRKGYRNHPLSEADKERNAEIAVTRSGGERPFATYKRNYGLRRTRFMGLAKNITFFAIAAIAQNIQKGARFFLLYGVRNPSYAG